MTSVVVALVARSHCRSSFREVAGNRSYEAVLSAFQAVVRWLVKVLGFQVAAYRWTLVADVPLDPVLQTLVEVSVDLASNTSAV